MAEPKPMRSHPDRRGVQCNVRLPEKMVPYLKAQAEKNRRSFANEVAYRLEMSVEAEKKVS